MACVLRHLMYYRYFLNLCFYDIINQWSSCHPSNLDGSSCFCARKKTFHISDIRNFEFFGKNSLIIQLKNKRNCWKLLSLTKNVHFCK